MTDTLTILEKVNAFYSGAFSQLITFTFGLLALVGVLIPVAIAAYQGRQLKKDHRLLIEKIEAEIDTAQKALAEQLAKDLEERERDFKALVEKTKEELDQKVEKINSLASARTFHLQALSNTENDPAFAAYDCLTAIEQYIDGEDEGNLRNVLLIWNKSISRAFSEDLSNHDDYDGHAHKAIKALSNLNSTGRYTADIQSIKRGLEEARDRKNPKI